MNTSQYTRLVVMLGVAASSGGVLAQELIVNGGFEAGLAGWSVTSQAGGGGSWYSNSGPATPVSGNATVGAAGGAFYGVTDQTGPGANALIQSITIPATAGTVTVSFDMFVNDQSGLGPIVDPAGLDYTAGANQHGRVDFLVAGAGALSTAPLDIVSNLYLGVDAGPNPHPYTPYAFDLTGILLPGVTYQLRFAQVDNQFFFNMGVDNVSVVAGVVPEAQTWLAAGGLAGLAGFAAWRRRRVA